MTVWRIIDGYMLHAQDLHQNKDPKIPLQSREAQWLIYYVNIFKSRITKFLKV